jgi:hypothetical protein
MGHVVRVMQQGNTFRMNVAATKPYNADKIWVLRFRIFAINVRNREREKRATP